MGDMLSVNCNGCGWSKSGFVGHGFNTLLNYEDIEHDLPKSFKKKLGEEKIVGLVSTPGIVVVCSSCCQIDFRTHYKALGIEAEHWCSRCRKKASIVPEPNALKICPECTNARLKINLLGIWD